jgi:K+-sensing histidine kinase KdpD
MRFVKRAAPVAVSLAVVSAVTAVLWYVKLVMLGPDHPLLLYLLPMALVAIVYGSWPALLGVFTAAFCADYFLYEPLYTFDIPGRAEMGDLICFATLAVIGVKCVSELFRPAAKIPGPDVGYARTSDRIAIRTVTRADPIP